MKKIELNSELRAMKLSILLTIAFSVIDIIIAVMSDSMTILLGGLCSLVDVIVAFLAIYVIIRVNRPADEKYHFGYAKFEPLMTALEGVLITAVCFSTIFFSIQDIIHPEPTEKVNIIVIYSFLSIFICLGFGRYMQKVTKQTRSKVIKVDASLWTVSGYISVAVCTVFALTGFMTRRFGSWYANYADPVLCSLMAIYFLKKPIAILKESFLDLVDANPHKEIKPDIDKITQLCRDKYQLSDIKWLKLRRAGRKIFAFICFNVEGEKRLKEVQAIKQNIIADVNREIPYADLYISFECRELS